MSLPKIRLILGWLVLTPLLISQTLSTVTSLPDSSIIQSSKPELLYGSLWRSVWKTPVTVPLIELNQDMVKDFSYDSTRLGYFSVGYTTKENESKRFIGIKKIGEASIDPDLQNSLVGNFVNYQTYSIFPYSAPVVVDLLSSLNVPYPKLQVCYLRFTNQTDSTKSFSEMGFSITPLSDYLVQKGYAIDTVLKGNEIYNWLEENNNTQFRADYYFSIRMMSCFVANAPIKLSHWQFYVVSTDKGKEVIPFLLKFENSFAKTDGLLNKLVNKFSPLYYNFDDDVLSPQKLLESQKWFDMRVLSLLSTQERDSLTAQFAKKLTDSTIDKAFQTIPIGVDTTTITSLKVILRNRLNNLQSCINKYLASFDKVVTVFCSNKDEQINIAFSGDSVNIIVKSSANSPHELFNRTFNSSTTDEIRIEQFAGKDTLFILGEYINAPKVRVIGESGEKVITLLENDNGKIKKGKSISVSSDVFAEDFEIAGVDYYGTKYFNIPLEFELLKSEQNYKKQKEIIAQDKYESNVPTFGSTLSVIPLLDNDGNRGAYFGFRPVLTTYDFRNEPYSGRYSFSVGYQSKTTGWLISFAVNKNHFYKDFNFFNTLEFNTNDSKNFFGYGNETVFNKDDERNGLYKYENRYLYIKAGFGLSLNKYVELKIFGGFDANNINLRNSNLLVGLSNTDGLNGGFATFNYGGALVYNTLDHEELPQRGMVIKGMATYYPIALDNKSSFGKAELKFSGYKTIMLLNDVTFALHFGGDRVWGNHPFNYASSIGGRTTIRGYYNDRFAGDGSIYGMAELYHKLGKMKVLIRSEFGLMASFDIGKVYVQDVNSNMIHTSYTAGIYTSNLERRLILAGMVSVSSEYVAFYTRFYWAL